MEKADRIRNAADRAARMQYYECQETAMTAFIETCRAFMTAEQWDDYYPEAKRSAGETFHIVTALIFALGKIQTPIVPELREAIESVIEVCGIDRNRWTDLRALNYDTCWRAQYGYDGDGGGDARYYRPHSPSEPGG